jgi:general secretion pathway protein E
MDPQPVPGAVTADVGEFFNGAAARVATSGPAAAAAGTYGVPFLTDLRDRAPSARFLERIPIGFARQHCLLGLAGDDDAMLPIVVRSLDDLPLAEVAARHVGRLAEPLLAPEADIRAAVNAAYQQRAGEAQTVISSLERRDVLAEVSRLQGREDLLDSAGRAPVIKLVNLILFEAVKAQASDVHVQPYEERLVVRMRVDGVLADAFEVPKGLQDEVVSRIKVMGRMNIAEKRVPQDGRAGVQVGDRTVDLRLSTLPTSYGERAVIRLLDKSVRRYALGELGMDPAALDQFRNLIAAEHGIVLVTGPTGSGKTTTLYAALQQLNGKERNILTLEDPIEYALEGVSQTQVSEKKGMTFAGGLRSVLRQDPDVIMVGEVRDRETAVMAIQSALTGHLVFSTLHTNDAASAIARLLDLGIEPYLLASSLTGVLAQRLVRRVCPDCGKPAAATPADLRRLGATGDLVAGDLGRVRAGVGCPNCRGTGYRGRFGLFELLVADEQVRQQIQDRAVASRIKAAAVAGGMKTLRDDGVRRLLMGDTTVDEVLRVTV